MLALLLTLATALAGSVELVLHDPHDRAAPADQCDVRLCTSLLQAIDSARDSIDLAIYGMRDQTALLTALLRAKNRGVRVRLVVDRDIHGNNYYSSTEALVRVVGNASDDEESDRTFARKEDLDEIEPLCERPDGFKGPPQCLSFDIGSRCVIGVHASREELTFQGHIMHNKFAVVDEHVVWTGSTNASNSGTGGYNANLVLLIDDKRVASWYTREFETMFDGRYHTDKTTTPMTRRTELSDGTRLSVLFSPQDEPMDRGVIPLIDKATQRIDVAVFFLTHVGVTEALLKARRRGVAIRVILDATGAKNGYTKHEVLRAGGIDVKIEDFGGKMHAKSAVIDRRYVIGGSMNWTSAGQNGNDENTVLLESPALARQYQAWFDTLWSRIDDRWLTDRPDPESRASGTACSDGSDNDFDKLADGADPGCSSAPPPLPELPPVRIVSKVGGRCPLPGQDDAP